MTCSLYEADEILPYRSEMGELEPGNLCVHTVWHDMSFLGTRSIGTDPFKDVLGYIGEWARILVG